MKLRPSLPLPPVGPNGQLSDSPPPALLYWEMTSTSGPGDWGCVFVVSPQAFPRSWDCLWSRTWEWQNPEESLKESLEGSLDILNLTDKDIKAHRGNITCLKSHSKFGAVRLGPGFPVIAKAVWGLDNLEHVRSGEGCGQQFSSSPGSAIYDSFVTLRSRLALWVCFLNRKMGIIPPFGVVVKIKIHKML